MATPENTMLNRVKKKLEADLGIEIEKTNNAFRGGRPDWDMFFPLKEGGSIHWPAQTAFVEGKHWPKQSVVGKDEDVMYVWDSLCSALQRKWLKGKAAMGFACYVLCGFKTRDTYLFFRIKADGPAFSKAGVMSYEQVRETTQNINN